MFESTATLLVLAQTRHVFLYKKGQASILSEKKMDELTREKKKTVLCISVLNQSVPVLLVLVTIGTIIFVTDEEPRFKTYYIYNVSQATTIAHSNVFQFMIYYNILVCAIYCRIIRSRQ